MSAGWDITATSNSDEFLQELNQVEHSFVYMIKTMEDVAEMIKENTIPLTPVETTRLGKSYKWTVLTDNSRMKVVQVRMSALNPRTGYDYAWIQHENMLYDHSNTNAKSSMAVSNIMYGHSATNNPTDHYLKEGIIQSQDGAFQMIEEDYLSLFYGGWIF